MTPRTQVPRRLAIRARRCEGDAAMARSAASLSMFAALAALLSTSCMATPPEGVPVGMAAPAHVSFATGYKGLSNEWGAADDQWTFGLVDGDWRPPGWPVWLAAQMLFSYDDDAPDAAPFFADWSETYELSLGVRRYGSWGRFEPWIGGRGLDWCICRRLRFERLLVLVRRAGRRLGVRLVCRRWRARAAQPGLPPGSGGALLRCGQRGPVQRGHRAGRAGDPAFDRIAVLGVWLACVGRRDVFSRFSASALD